METRCRHHRRPIPFLSSTSVLLPSDDGPRTRRTMIPQCCFSQAREPQQPPGEQDKQPPSSKSQEVCGLALSEPAQAGLQKETRAQTLLREARRPSLIAACPPLPGKEFTCVLITSPLPPQKASLRVRDFKRTERSKTVARPHAKAPSGARVNLSGEPYSEHQHTLHIISLALLPRTRASQAAELLG